MSLQVLSLGAGVQSSTLALMSEYGELPRLDAAIFADTGAEPAAVYEWLEHLKEKLSYPVYTVSNGNLTVDSIKTVVGKRSGKRYINNGIPVFLRSKFRDGVFFRHCTNQYKIQPVQKKIRELLSESGETVAEQWIGISIDEAHRMKESRVENITNIFPLIDLRMRRSDCLAWAEKKKMGKPPRSSCVYCPYNSDKKWLDLKNNDPQGWNVAVEFERKLQQGFVEVVEARRAGEATPDLFADTENPPIPYLHRKRIPIDQVELDGEDQLDLFGEECEGMCGV